MSKSVYISMPAGLVSRDDIGFYANIEALWQDYSGRDKTLRAFTRQEFVEAIEDTEVVEERGWAWYKDTMEV